MTTIPSFDCGGCTKCCHQVVPCNADEKAAIAKRYPHLNWTLTEKGWVMTAVFHTFTCPLLTKDGCGAYDIRPLACQLYGSVDHPLMRCKEGRRPDKLLSHKTAQKMIRKSNLRSARRNRPDGIVLR